MDVQIVDSQIKFTAESLEDIAKQLDALASMAQREATRETTAKDRRFKEGQAYAYQNFADVLRKTTLIKPTGG